MNTNPYDAFRGKNILITGHTGFKGGWLSLWLAKLGSRVTGYALDPAAKEGIFEAAGLSDEMVDIRGDIRDSAKLQNVFESCKPEFVFHLAAQPLVGLSYAKPRETYETNVMGTLNVLECIRHSDSVRAAVIVTSDKCYENREQIWGYREKDKLGGYDPYSSSKGCAELLIASWRNSFLNPSCYEAHGKGIASARAGNVIGGGDWAEGRLIPDCIRALYKKEPIKIRHPDAIRPWQFVLEPLWGYLLLASKLLADGSAYSEAWNFGPDDQNVKTVEWVVGKLCEKWDRAYGYEVDEGQYPHEARLLKLDCSKARHVLGWRPAMDTDEALGKVVEWAKAYLDGCGMKNLAERQIEKFSTKIAF